MQETMTINLTVNGKRVSATVPTKAHLLEFLGEKMSPTSGNKRSVFIGAGWAGR